MAATSAPPSPPPPPPPPPPLAMYRSCPAPPPSEAGVPPCGPTPHWISSATAAEAIPIAKLNPRARTSKRPMTLMAISPWRPGSNVAARWQPACHRVDLVDHRETTGRAVARPTFADHQGEETSEYFCRGAAKRRAALGGEAQVTPRENGRRGED